MSYERCALCGVVSTESQFCPSCGKARKKWCPRCGKWKMASFNSIEVDDPTALVPIVIADYDQVAIFCPDCGTGLETKGAAHE